MGVCSRIQERGKVMEANEKRRPRGSGSIYQQPGSRFLWVAFHDANGKLVRESSKSEKVTDAQNLLKKRAGEAANGTLIAPKVQRITVSELFEAVTTDYRNNEKTIAWV